MGLCASVHLVVRKSEMFLYQHAISLLTLDSLKRGKETDEREKRVGFEERAGRWVDTNSMTVITHE